MTRAPENLLALRGLLLAHLNIDDSRVRSEDLEPAEVGIVGDTNHRGGYHCGSDRVVANDYSVVESPRDRNGLTLDAAALDVGMFEVTVGGRTYDLPHFSAWCVAQCKAGAPDARDIREIIWSPDSRVVRRWDALGRRTSGDDSHRWHTHFSFFRDSIKAGRDLTPLFERYLTSVGLIEPEDTVTPEDFKQGFYLALAEAANPPAGDAGRRGRQTRDFLRAIVGMEATSPGELSTALAAMPKPDVDALAAALAPKLAVALPAGPIGDEQLERVLRSVLGSLNDTPS